MYCFVVNKGGLNSKSFSIYDYLLTGFTYFNCNNCRISQWVKGIQTSHDNKEKNNL